MKDIYYIINECFSFEVFDQTIKGFDPKRKYIFTDKGVYNRYGQKMIVNSPYTGMVFENEVSLFPLIAGKKWNEYKPSDWDDFEQCQNHEPFYDYYACVDCMS